MYKWLKVVHVIGFLTWTGSLVACLSVLRRHGDVTGDARTLLSEIERKFALSMDIAATITIAAGLYIALGLDFNMFKPPAGVWLHIKSTLVFLLILVHGFTRMKVGKFRKNADETLPVFVLPVTFALLTGIVIFAVVKPIMS